MAEKETVLLMQDLHFRISDMQNRFYENMTREEKFRTDYAEDTLALTELQKELIIIDERMKAQNLKKWTEVIKYV